MILAISILLKVTLVAALALIGIKLARRSRAALRHLLLGSAFVILLFLPAASFIAPAIRIPLPLAPVLRHIARASTPMIDATEFISSPATRGTTGVAPPAISSLPSFSTLMFLAWLLGFVMFLIPVLRAYFQMRQSRQSALPWRQGQIIAAAMLESAGWLQHIEIVLHEATPSPITCGILRPAIMFPLDARDWAKSDLLRALRHEIEHVRRRDWVTRFLARTVCAAYWFHPLVWMMWQQFSLEAERSCDDAVLEHTDAGEYADQLVSLAERLSASALPTLGMANRRDLATRVTAILDYRQLRGRAGAVRVSATGLVTLLLIFAISPLHIVAGSQSPASPNQSVNDNRKFEVASVKPCKEEPVTNGQRRPEFTSDPGRVTIQCIPLARIIYFAYAGIGSMDHPLLNDHPSNPDHVRGGPGWIQSDKFTIEGKAEGTADRTVLMGPMLRALLEDRFKLKTHREKEEVPMYALTVAKGGLKVQALADGGCTSFEAAQNLSREDRLAVMQSKPICGSFSSLGDGVNANWILGGETLSRFAVTLSGVLDRYVLDQTNVSGEFNIHLHFGLDESIKAGVFGGRPALTYSAENPPSAGIEKGPSIFSALEEELGLKLEKTRGTRESVMIDRVERPVDNQ